MATQTTSNMHHKKAVLDDGCNSRRSAILEQHERVAEEGKASVQYAVQIRDATCNPLTEGEVSIRGA